ncbi:hypothetical protein AbraIFM66951_004486 [Aspergillus brasiliensis]|uniref:Uncharacterized protein n=1 Tax=Aspergillus brasiliensis TaxID=319629 RepID=A0A9W6DSE4_9EURO|nr:hypothetical protein AbraCBS73388_001540 [Aspergillus brasiliensis]GKZ43387.1 hypothetical protein AbraIFM66951_004486 [Aspergillus brasiliensis]
MALCSVGPASFRYWRSSGNAGDEPPSGLYSFSGWPTPLTSSNQPSPSRREHAVQLPPLTTSLGGHQFQGLGLALGSGYTSTPLSSTSLSSPFTQGQSPAVGSPGGAAIGSSPMASRQYNVPYNPQDWGPVGSGSMNAGQTTYTPPNNMLRIVSQPRSTGPHSDVSLSPPPPPYSPPSQQHQRENVSQNASSMGSTSPSISSSYNGAVRTGVDAPSEYRQRRLPRTRPLSMFVGSESSHNRRVSLPPPPPLPPGLSSRSSSQNRVETYREPTAVMAGPGPHIVVSPETIHSTQMSDDNNMLEPSQPFDTDRPPAARRAVSAGPAVNSASSSRAHSQSGARSPPGTSWEPGMPLPPPPPGPPPATRSQSVNGLSDASSSRNSQGAVRTGRARPPPALGTSLESIPPTPAGWVEESIDVKPRADRQPLTIDTATTSNTSGPESLESSRAGQNPNSGGLFRSPAIKDPNAKGIRERRIERRNRQSQVLDSLSAVSMSSNPWAEALEQLKPSNLVLGEANVDTDNGRNQASVKAAPLSTRSISSDGPQFTSRSRASSGGLFSNRSCSTPKPEPSPQAPTTTSRFAQTPPFSPGTERSSAYPKRTSPALPPKALPTPPLHSGSETTPSRPGSKEERPVSHILHLPNEPVTTVSPLAPRRVSTQQNPSLDSVVHRDDEFVRNAIQRHREFIEKEAGTMDEKEALRLFTEFIISESQIRRERYAKVWDLESFDVESVHRKLFVSPPKPAPLPQTSQIVPGPSSRRVSNPTAPKLDIPQVRPESAWWNNYQPCLSPIASLGLSNDEMSSRGRAPSRWWESKTGSSSEGGERRVQRSKRETKYMGLSRGALLWEESQGSSDTGNAGTSNGGNQYAAYGPDEYPPEKVGWHEEPVLADYPNNTRLGSSRRFEEVQSMDVSRLITLPPPYPRHYPAVNNSHPDLVTYRTLVRSITDVSEIKTARQRHQTELDGLFQDHQARVQEGRRQFKANIQSQIQQGSITFAEAAEAEAALIVEENRLERDLIKGGLDTYQESVFKPMRAILADRIDRATACIDELRGRLFDDARSETPDQTQEEGDEKPELLEKLTQLKWLFEAREQLHREVFDLISDRDEKYRAVVLLPYKQASNEEKVRETNEFFVKDALDRRVEYEANALARLESFLDVVEGNVARGVEIQLSAFWDIAPSLSELVQQIPEKLRGFTVQIPANEYDENPSYRAHPLQYLYTLVSHAEKSSYQYIESQINLFCLLHEVKSAVMRASCNLMEAERIRLGETEGKVQQEMQETRTDEERTLTSDLKDKVATVEGQWAEALGSGIQRLRERVKEQLMVEDGWEDLEQLEQA